jgi:hypothetical protein
MSTSTVGAIESILKPGGGPSLNLQAEGAALVQPKTAGAWSLPEKGEALKLVASDFEAAAKELGVETAAVHAVAFVEAGGRTGFDAHSRPKILFETHHFRANTKGVYNKTHPALTAPFNSKLQQASYKLDQWTVIREAFELDPEAAVMSASWGMFQVLGSNAKDCGWQTIEQFVTDMFYSEGQHMRAFLGFCRANHLTKYLDKQQWASFARGYNGPNYAKYAYDTKMANAYARYSGKAVGGTHKAKARHKRKPVRKK